MDEALVRSQHDVYRDDGARISQPMLRIDAGSRGAPGRRIAWTPEIHPRLPTATRARLAERHPRAGTNERGAAGTGHGFPTAARCFRSRVHLRKGTVARRRSPRRGLQRLRPLAEGRLHLRPPKSCLGEAGGHRPCHRRSRRALSIARVTPSRALVASCRASLRRLLCRWSRLAVAQGTQAVQQAPGLRGESGGWGPAA